VQNAINRVQKELIRPQILASKSALVERSPSDRYCARFFKQVEDFRANLSPGHDMQATLISPDGSVVILNHIDSSHGQEIVCTGVNEAGKQTQIIVSISAAVLRLEEIPLVTTPAKQRIGFRPCNFSS